MKFLNAPNRMTWLALGTSLFVLVMAVLVIAREWDVLIAFPWRLNVGYLTLTMLFHSLALGVTFVVWHLMVARLGHFDNLVLNFRFYYLSTLAKRIPTAIWYVGGRLAMYQPLGVSASEILNCILLENTIITIAGVFALLIFLPFYAQLPKVNIVPIILAGTAGIVVLLMRPRLFVDITNWILKRLGKPGLSSFPARKDILLWGGLYILPWLFAGISFYCATRAFSRGTEVGLVDAIGISTLAMLVALLSMVLPGGLGLRELTSSVLLAHWMPFSSAIVISVAYRLVQTANEMAWALVAARLFSPRTKNFKTWGVRKGQITKKDY